MPVEIPQHLPLYNMTYLSVDRDRVYGHRPSFHTEIIARMPSAKVRQLLDIAVTIPFQLGTVSSHCFLWCKLTPIAKSD